MPDEAPRSPPQSSEEARRFLAALDRGPQLVFRSLMDDKARKAGARPVELTGTFDEHAQQLRRLNDAGHGIFVQIGAADGKGAKAANIVGMPALFADFDGVPLENVERLGLPPHVVVETSPGKRHYYWRAGDIPLDQFSAIQKRLIGLFGSDRSIHDLPRIMRLPGFLHQKNPEVPALVRVIEQRDDPPYALAAFLDALAAAEKAQGIQVEAPRTKLPPLISASGDRDPSAELAVAESALRHCIAADMLHLDDRDEWIRVGIALKASCGEDGFALWVQLSSEAEGFEGEEDCRGQWVTFKDDRPDDKKLTIASFVSIAQAHGWKRPRGLGGGAGAGSKAVEASGEDGGGKGGKAKADAATTVLDQAEAAGDEHFASPEGLFYVTYKRPRPDGSVQRVTCRLTDSAYAGELRMRFHDASGTKAAPAEQVNSAVALMEARARASGVVHRVYLRSAHHDGKLYVNLDPRNGVVAEIDASPDGWRIISDPPVRFVAGSRGALPLPERGGTLDTFRPHFNVSDDDLRRVIGFMLGVFQVAEAYPVAILEGEAAAAKSNFGDKMVALTDPPVGTRKGARFSMATDERNMHVQAARCSVMFYDNLSSFSAEVADQICRLATGAASSYRVHHTMDEEQQFVLSRPVIITCISLPSARGDLLSRSVRVEVLPAGQRRTEQAVWRAFDADEGKMLGFLFSSLSAILRNRAAVSARFEAGEVPLPRMADFAVWVEGAAELLGLPFGGFAALMNAEQAVIQAESAMRDPIVEGLATYFADPDAKALDITARDLRDLLAARHPAGDLPPHNQIQARLKRNLQGLRELGIQVEFVYDTHRKVHRFAIGRVEEPGDGAAEPSSQRDDQRPAATPEPTPAPRPEALASRPEVPAPRPEAPARPAPTRPAPHWPFRPWDDGDPDDPLPF